MNRLSGKVAILSGAANGIGKAICLRFAEESAWVLVTDIDTQNGERTLEEIRQRGADGAFCEEDLGDERQIEGAVAGSAPMARAYSRTTTSVTTSRGSSLTPMSW